MALVVFFYVVGLTALYAVIRLGVAHGMSDALQQERFVRDEILREGPVRHLG
jgi:hypothetical protein